ncbi:MAG: SagB/ThcOx family dehydrogenase [Candidatus Hydrothermales bacterium]
MKIEKPPPQFKTYPDKPKIKLPAPTFKGMILEEAIKKRRSVREYSDKPLTLDEVSQILFAAQGITGELAGVYLRTVPSAGALYPIEIYLIVQNVEGLKKGIYHYNVREHSLEFIKEGDFKNEIFKAGLFQEMFLSAPLTLIYTAIFKRTTYKYDDRGYRYVYMEAGHVAQNVSLQCVSLGLSSCVIGAFFDSMVDKLIGVDGKEETSIYIQTVGRPK